MSVFNLQLTAAQLSEIIEHVERELPNEACGLLGGPPGKVERVYRVANVYRSPVAYHLDPTEQVRAMLEIEALGWEVCGIFHSHPSGPSVPSTTDVSLAFYPEAVYVIASPGGSRWQVRGFHIDGGQVREVPLRVAG